MSLMISFYCAISHTVSVMRININVQHFYKNLMKVNKHIEIEKIIVKCERINH